MAVALFTLELIAWPMYLLYENIQSFTPSEEGSAGPAPAG